MLERWYGDKRDLVKWSVLIETAKKYNIKNLLWVVFYRDKSPELEIVHKEVRKHFKDIHQIKQLGNNVGIKIDVFEDEKWERKNRSAYIEMVLKRIGDAKKSKLLVFLDPDTGLGKKLEHVKKDELKKIFTKMQMRKGNCLVFYQHAQRVDKWKEKTRANFEAEIDKHWIVSNPSKDYSSIANDVIFFIVTKR